MWVPDCIFPLSERIWGCPEWLTQRRDSVSWYSAIVFGALVFQWRTRRSFPPLLTPNSDKKKSKWTFSISWPQSLTLTLPCWPLHLLTCRWVSEMSLLIEFTMMWPLLGLLLFCYEQTNKVMCFTGWEWVWWADNNRSGNASQNEECLHLSKCVQFTRVRWVALYQWFLNVSSQVVVFHLWTL